MGTALALLTSPEDSAWQEPGILSVTRSDSSVGPKGNNDDP
jgi:hypothetical protein